MNWVHPLFLKSKAALRKEDNPNWWEAMLDPSTGEYWTAAVTKVESLEAMDAWEVVDCTENMNVCQSS